MCFVDFVSRTSPQVTTSSSGLDEASRVILSFSRHEKKGPELVLPHLLSQSVFSHSYPSFLPRFYLPLPPPLVSVGVTSFSLYTLPPEEFTQNGGGHTEAVSHRASRPRLPSLHISGFLSFLLWSILSLFISCDLGIFETLLCAVKPLDIEAKQRRHWQGYERLVAL